DACLHFGLEAFVGITGENPLFDPRHCMQARALLADGADLERFNGLPIGCAAYGVGMHALRTICDVKQEVDTEIWGYLLHRPALFEVRTVEVDPALRLPGVRLTIDYPEDLDLMRAIFARLPGAPALADVVALLRAEPELLRINAHRKQADLPAEAKARLDAFFATEHGRIAELLRRYREQA
ncbi:MAG: hypothetical protein RBT71_10210, partial [Flavobacteriales bacterium]|nr:hypothetical protein [Flavobacteriales bacterium]